MLLNMKTAIRTFILAVSMETAVLQAATIQSSSTFGFYNPTSSTYNTISESGFFFQAGDQEDSPFLDFGTPVRPQSMGRLVEFSKKAACADESGVMPVGAQPLL
jgi:hypothetical protein